MSPTRSSGGAEDDALRRAALPEVLFLPDLAIALGLQSASAARRALLRGDCGPYLRIGRRLAIRREALLQSLAAREVHPLPRSPGPGQESPS